MSRALRWWPVFGVAATLLLGWVVGKSSTSVDDWFLHDFRRVVGAHPRALLLFTDWRLLSVVSAICVGVALYRRRWRLAALIVLSPVVAIGLDELFKRLFDRHKGDALAYPSGHATSVVVVMGMVVLVAGVRWWSVMAAIVVSVLGMLGEILCGYHYFTDIVGAALLGTALLCLAPSLSGAPPGGEASRGL